MYRINKKNVIKVLEEHKNEYDKENEEDFFAGFMCEFKVESYQDSADLELLYNENIDSVMNDNILEGL